MMSGAKGGGYGMSLVNVKNGNWWVLTVAMDS